MDKILPLFCLARPSVEDMYKVNQRISCLWIIIFLMMTGASAVLQAADHNVGSAGDWENPDTGTLAEALQDPTLNDGSTITLENNITGGWTNWLSGGTYTIFTAPPLQTAGGILNFKLDGFAISGAPFDIVTGNATFQFYSGTLGVGGPNFGVGVTGNSTVTLYGVDLFAGVLQIGSETSRGILTLQNSSTISATTLNVIGDGSRLTLGTGTTVSATNFSILDGGRVDSNGGTITATNLAVDGYGSRLTTNANGTIVTLSIMDGGALVINSGSTFTVSGDLTVSGAGVEETGGDYDFLRSALSGKGTLLVTKNIIIDGGADVDFSTLLPSFTATATHSLTIGGVFFDSVSGTSYQTSVQMAGLLVANAGGTISVTGGAELSGITTITANTGGTITIGGVFSDKLSGKNHQTMVTMNGDLTTLGGTINVTDGAKLSGVDNITANGGTLSVKGADGEKYRSEIAGSGILTISGGTINVEGGGLIGGRTGITVGDGTNGTLNVSGMNAAMMLSSTINSSGELVVGDGAVGTLKIDGGGLVTAGTTTIGQGVAGSSVTVAGTGTGDRHSRLTITGDLILSESADASMTISQGGQVTVSGNTYLGNTDGKTATLTLAGRGGSGATDARLNTTGQVVVGNGGDVNLTINLGGNVTSGRETILGRGATSNVTVSINSDHYRAAWNAGGEAQTPGVDYEAPLGNSYLYVKGGLVYVSGLFAMAGDYSSTGLTTTNPNYGNAVFESNGELHMTGGTFINMNTDAFESDSKGFVTIGSGGIVSGSGSIYAGEQFIVNGGTIAPGSRGMYDFNRSNNDKLQSLGTLDIYDREDKDTLFHNATFRTELDRGTAPDNSDGLSDRAIVYGNLDFDSNFTIDFSRPLDGRYLIIRTDGEGNDISNFFEQDLMDFLDFETYINLNGKPVTGNRRLQQDGGLFTTIENSDTEIWLNINTTSQGNVKTYWTGDAGTEWSMTAENFEARETGNIHVTRSFLGDDQFLDGDIVYFSYDFVDSTKRDVVITTNLAYIGDSFVGWHGGPNVRVAEINVYGDHDGTPFIWSGGSIYAIDSALYTTLDQIDNNGKTPSGQFNKIGSGILEIHNANEFYGGIHLGGIDPHTTLSTTGGLIQLYNEKGLGTYDSTSGFQQKGLVSVHEDSTIEIMSPGITVNNRFIVDRGKVLTFVFPGDFTIAGNNALASDETTHDGKGGGVFVGDEGRIIYTGSGKLFLKDNKAKAGGGIYTELGYTLQVPAYISGNYASGKGGGVYAERHFSLKDGSDISGNAAQEAGGGIYIGNKGTLTEEYDRSFFIHGNTQVTNNQSGGEAGGGIFVEAGRNLVIHTARTTEDFTTFGGGDVWFEGNYAKVGFDADNPAGGAKDTSNAYRNAIHLSRTATTTTGLYFDKPATLEIFGPYNTYFYDAISGDIGTKVTIQGVQATTTNNDHSLPSTQYGTTIFHDDSEFYGSTQVLDGATLRLESFTDPKEGVVDAIYGRRGSQEGMNNTFTLGTGSWITGQGTIAADSIILQGNLNLDTGTFSQPGRPDKVGDPPIPPGRNGSGAVQTAGTMQGVLNLDGDVTIEDTSNWFLTLGPGGTTDLVNVTGEVTFDKDASLGEKIRFDIDDLIRGKYLVLTASDGISGFSADKQKSDAEIYLGLNNLATNDPLTGSSDPVFGRVKATSYVETNGTDLYLDLGGRNRHVSFTKTNDIWGYVDTWTFAGVIPAGTIGAGNWEENDAGPATNVYLDGDMVTITGVAGGRTVTLTTPVRPVDLFVNGAIGADVLINGASGITTYSTTGTGTYGPRGTTIRPEGSTEVNDYNIDYYTGKLHKSEANKLTFATGANLFTEGIEFNVGGGNAGVISFSNVNQLTVGTGRTIDFLENGTLQLNLTGTSGTLRTSAGAGTNIRIADDKTATFDISANALTVAGVISNINASSTGAIEKIGTGTLVLSGANTFTGGTTFKAGTIEIRNEKALGTTASLLPANAAGLVDVRGTGTKNLAVNGNYTISNHFDVSGIAGNTLSIDIASGRTLTIDNNNVVTGTDGGAIFVDTGQGQLTFGGTGDLTIRNNTAESGGGIYSGVNSLLTFRGATTFTSNTATVGSGGGLYNADAVTFNGAATIQSNTAQTNGGGIDANGAVTFNGETTIQSNEATDGSGGGVHATGNVTLNNNDGFTLGGTGGLGNTARTSGGGIYSGGNVTLNGTGAKSIDGNTAGTSGGGIYSGGTVDFQGTAEKTISNNSATGGSGGAVFAQNISLTGSATITGNTAASGGAFYVDGDKLTLLPTAAGDLIRFYDNTATNGSAVFLNGNAGIQIGGTNPTAGNVIFDDSIYGLSGSSWFTTMSNFTGTVMFAGDKSSTFNGDTTINNGTFRTTQGTTYGGTGTFVLLENNIVNPNSVKLTGGGTLEASAFDLHGVVSPDKNTESTAVPTSITGDERFGILTFQGAGGGNTVVTMYGNDDPLSYQYEAHLAAGTTADDPNAWKTNGQSDLLSIVGTFYAEIGTDTLMSNPEKIVINVHNFGVGKYLLIEATDLLVTRNGTPEEIDDHDLDGIGDAAGAFTLLVHEAEKTNRHLVLFLRGNEQIDSPDGWSNSVYANDAYNQYVDEHGMNPGDSVYDDLFTKAQNELWLATQTYNLLMYWTGKNTGDGATDLWQGTNSEASGNWREKMFSHSLEPETHFMHADSVVFAETYPDYSEIPEFTDSGSIGNRAIVIEGSGVRVTNMLVDNLAGAANTYSFSGGGITTTPNYAGDELDDLLGYTPGNAPQQLVKKNTGTLTFTNAANTFAGGIVFETSGATNAGIITFTNANQLGDGDEGITFKENGTLQASTTNNMNLGNKIFIAGGKTATIDTQALTLTLSGLISQTAADGALTKTGTGTLILDNTDNTYRGTTTVSQGTLQANGVGTLGWNDFGHVINIASGAFLNLNIASGPQTLSQLISGAGTVQKSGTGELIFDQVNNTYSGGTTIMTGMLTVKHVEHEILFISQNGGLGTGNVVINATGANTGLNFDIEEDGTFSKIISGAGMVTKSGDETLTLSGTSTYTGATNIDGGKVLLTNINGTGNNAAGTTTTVNLAAGTELEINVAAASTYNKIIAGAGHLTTNGTLTLAGTNTTFTGGTTQKGGTLTLGNVSAIGDYATPGGTAGSLHLTANGTTTFGVAGTYRNRFVIDPGLTWTLNGSANSTIFGVQSEQNGGAIYLGAGSTANIANTGAWTFTGNTGTGGVPNDIYLDGATMNITAAGNQFFNSGIAGTGTITKSATGTGITQIAADSAFNGSTTIEAGMFRIVDNKTFGTAAATFTLDDGATLAGQGTIKADSITITGNLSPDSDTLSATKLPVGPGVERFGTITLEGTTVNLGGVGETFMMDYDLGIPSTTASRATPTGDLLAIDGAATLYGGTINFQGTITTGSYLVVDADQTIEIFDTAGGKLLDGITHPTNGVLGATLNGNALNNNTPRHGLGYRFGDANGTDSQIWLDVEVNTLTMDWKNTNTTAIWNNSAASWESKQWEHGTAHEYVFRDGDYVNFIGNNAAGQTITVAANVIVSGMTFDDSYNITFDGSGGIASRLQTTPTDTIITGKFIDPGTGIYTDPVVTPDGKLQKSGTGTLTFANGANLFTEGIDIAAGTVGFNHGNQLQVGSGKAITFTGAAANNAKLQANASTTLATNVIVTTGNKGTFATLTNVLTNTGSISIAGNGAIEWATGSGGFLFQDGVVTGTGTSTITKTGVGTAQIGTNPTFAGATTVSDGTFRVVQGVSYGTPGSGSFTVGTNGTIAGGGIITADTVSISGTISPDSDTLSAEKLSVDAARKFGVLTLDGNVTLNGFTMKYDVDMGKVQNTKVTTADIDTGDLLRIIDAGSSVLVGGTIDIQATSLDTGYYLIAESTTAFNTGINPLDGINETGGVLHLALNGSDLTTLSPRTLYQFSYGDTSTTTNARIWLHADTNSLTMDWQNGDGTWNTTVTVHWESLQTNAGNHEDIFRNGDYVRFLQTTDASIDITAGTRIVSGMVVNNDVNTTFTGTGGIRSTEDDPSIIGKYLPTGVGTPTLTPDGKLQKTGAGMLTFENTGGNLFEEGIDIAAGTIGFNRSDQLQVGSGKAITFTGIAANNARLQANAAITTLATDIIVEAGNKGTIYTLANSLTHTGDIVTIDNGEIELATATGGFLFQDSAVTGTGTVTKTGAGTVQIGTDSAFNGATTVSGGTFRVVDNKTFGGTATSFTAEAGTTVAGGGTIRATQITLAGAVTPDSAVFATGSMAVLPANRFGTITLDGKVNLASTFSFNYNAGTLATGNGPIASAAITAGYSGTTGDLIKMQNGGVGGYTIHDGATVNFVDTLVSGKYLIFMADQGFMLDGGTGELDGVKAGGVSRATFGAPENQTPRGSFEFIWGTSATGTNDIKSQIWLDVDRNTLEMTWHDTPESNIWVSAAGDANFLSTQKGIDGSTQEQMFNDGDYVIFDTKTDDQEITIGNATDTDGVIVSGMNVDANSNYTFTGNGITALTAHETIEGDYIGLNPLFLPKVNPDGKLQKSGTGVLTFSNGANRFTKGIEISGGTIAFSNANQLNTLDVDPGNTDRGITFLESGTLRSNANIPSLANNIKLSNLATATFDTNGFNMTLYGNIDDLAGTGNVTKEGQGTLTLTDITNNWNGTTDVKSGTLLAIGIETLGNNAAHRTITVESGATLILQIAATETETLRQELCGGGEVRKTGAGDLIFTTDSPDFDGRFNFAAGDVYLNGTDFHNSDSFRVGMGVTLFGTGFLGSRGMAGGVIQEGAKLIPNGVVANNPSIPPDATTLNISGNLSFEKGSLYQVVITQYTDPTYDLDNPDRMRPVNDMIVVDSGGTVKIDKDAELNVLIDYWSNQLAPTDFGATTSGRFTIIDATDGNVADETVRFILLEAELPRGVELTHGWNGLLYQLWFVSDPSGMFEANGITPNQKEIGKLLDYLMATKDPGMQELLQILSQREITDDMLRDILGQLAGDLRANSIGMALKMPWRHPFNRIDRDMFPRPFDPCQPITCRPEYKYTREFWAEGYGSFSNTRFDGNAYANTVRRLGMAVGFDQRICDYSLIGAVFNYSKPLLYQDTGRAEADDYEIGIYNLTKITGTVDLKSYFGYSHQEYDLRRHVYIPAGARYDAVYDSYRNKTRGDSFAMSFELLRPMDYNDYVTIAPLIALDYERVWQKGYSESGGLTALRYDNATLERLMLRFGVNTKVFASNRFDMHTRIQYATQLNYIEYPRSGTHFVNATVGGAPTANIRGSSIGRDHMNIGIGGEYYLNQKRSMSVHFGYDADMWKRMSMHTGNIGYTHRW